ncbi:MAG: cytochrome c oxidase subunit 3 family protein [Candidatus Marinamargulisbacteria bacterium]|jgi:cytochrome c oxidase subunit III|nr:cytochrome c oxidase subunit 3 family protein [Candidatus Marinamargulisbacteria bacterium]|tara:strand:+ start:5751 stop:6416 length:666 start_codon:yes stop_codon:yes gene_type:complete
MIMKMEKSPMLKTIPHHVAHHFEDADQEFDAAKIGMWLFLAQELLFFSALFVGYGVFRFLHPETFVHASKLLSWKMGLVNTMVLISSSFTMVMAVWMTQMDRVRVAIRLLWATAGLAMMFMVIKYFEYSAKIHHGYLPGSWFSAADAYEHLHLFFTCYFLITGLHGIHVLIGVGLILWLIRKSKQGYFHKDYYTPLEMVGLYWHLVDIVWIFVFPLLYLVG